MALMGFGPITCALPVRKSFHHFTLELIYDFIHMSILWLFLPEHKLELKCSSIEPKAPCCLPVFFILVKKLCDAHFND